MFDSQSRISPSGRNRGTDLMSPLVIYAAVVTVSLGIVTALTVLSLTV